MHQSREQDLRNMTDAELRAEHERLQRKHYRETGIMPPPLPDFSAMTDEELEAYEAYLTDDDTSRKA